MHLCCYEWACVMDLKSWVYLGSTKHAERFRTKAGDTLPNSWPVLFFPGADNATSMIPIQCLLGTGIPESVKCVFHWVERPHLCWLSDFKWYLALSNFLCFSPYQCMGTNTGSLYCMMLQSKWYLVETNMIDTTCIHKYIMIQNFRRHVLPGTNGEEAGSR